MTETPDQQQGSAGSEKQPTEAVADLLRKNEELSRENEALRQRFANREQIELVLERERLILQTVVENIPDAIYAKDTAGRKILANPADVRHSRRTSAAELIGKTDFDLYPAEIAAGYFADDQTVLQGGQAVLWREEYLFDDHGEKHWILTSKIPMRSADGRIVGLVGVGRDITPIKKAEEKLERTYRELVSASRAAGMAEVATNVLHNVGNVLNSVNVSATTISDGLAHLKIDSVSKLAKLLRDHAAELADFLTRDERGTKVPSFLEDLADHLERERTWLRAEARNLQEKVDHIKQIVAMQQNYAKLVGVTERVAIVDVVDDALALNADAHARHGVAVVRNYQANPTLLVDRHKILQILVNLFSNAKYACDASNRKDKQVKVSIHTGAGNVRIEVADNGVGIARENLTRVFTQGFTTRENGHGFGLHGGILAAQELGGSLTAQSDGPGTGATFVLEFPIASPPDSTAPAESQSENS
jgi:PAS domain S-box-containing protein